MRKTLYIVAFLLALFAPRAVAQGQKFLIRVDTAGVMPYPGQNHAYVTWVYALSSPTSFPSSAILVAFDCAGKKVMRLAHIKYQWNATKTGVEGPVVTEEHPEWVDISIPEMFAVVCRVGPTHGKSVIEPTLPDANPQPPSDPRWRRA